jgi:5-methyltetrahydropteroyltriglutamate--homocysteine methyltransferase
MVQFATATLGFGRMGPNRELKYALEKYWKKSITESELMQTAHQVEDLTWTMQVDAGIDRIPVGDYCLYDNVATWSEALGIVPRRFSSMERGIDRMFAMCRGVDDAPALSK